MAKYGKAAQKRVKSAMHRRKKGTLKSSSGKKVTSRKQAIAIGLSEAREKGGKVPRRKSASSVRSNRQRARICETKRFADLTSASITADACAAGEPPAIPPSCRSCTGTETSPFRYGNVASACVTSDAS